MGHYPRANTHREAAESYAPHDEDFETEAACCALARAFVFQSNTLFYVCSYLLSHVLRSPLVRTVATARAIFPYLSLSLSLMARPKDVQVFSHRVGFCVVLQGVLAPIGFRLS